MTFRRPKKPGSRSHVKRTPAQERALRVFRLRGVWWMAHALTSPRREAAQALIDAEIADLGAEPEGDRHLRRTRERDERWAAEDAKRAELDELIPF